MRPADGTDHLLLCEIFCKGPRPEPLSARVYRVRSCGEGRKESLIGPGGSKHLYLSLSHILCTIPSPIK